MGKAEALVLTNGDKQRYEIRDKVRPLQSGSLGIRVDARGESLIQITIDKTEGIRMALRDEEGELLLEGYLSKDNGPIVLFDNRHTLQLQGGAGGIYIRPGIDRKREIPTLTPQTRRALRHA
ncbi:MAG: hypothetical protein AAB531_01065 [Patescibacteria group bacterium]|mgnify:CR=1 FL=1